MSGIGNNLLWAIFVLSIVHVGLVIQGFIIRRLILSLKDAREKPSSDELHDILLSAKKLDLAYQCYVGAVVAIFLALVVWEYRQGLWP